MRRRMESCGTRVTPAARRRFRAALDFRLNIFAGRVCRAAERQRRWRRGRCSASRRRMPGGERRSSSVRFGRCGSCFGAGPAPLLPSLCRPARCRSAMRPEHRAGFDFRAVLRSRISDSTPADVRRDLDGDLVGLQFHDGIVDAHRSPTFFSHVLTTALVPSCSVGTTMSVAIQNPISSLDLGCDLLDGRQRPFQQRRIVRAGNVRHRQARDRRVEIEEAFLARRRRRSPRRSRR